MNGGPDDAGVQRAKEFYGVEDLGWEMEKPIEFVDSRAYPSVQIADILASTVVNCYSNGMPTGFDIPASILDAGMLKDSIFPDFDRVKFENPQTLVNYSVLYKLAEQAEGQGLPFPIDVIFELAEAAVASGDLVPPN